MKRGSLIVPSPSPPPSPVSADRPPSPPPPPTGTHHLRGGVRRGGTRRGGGQDQGRLRPLGTLFIEYMFSISIFFFFVGFC